MNRFFLTPDHIHASQITFPSEIAHQIRHVLRLWDGDCVEVVDNTGMVYQVQLLPMTQSNEVVGSILGPQAETAEPGIALHLLFVLTSRRKVEWILRKGTEIGVPAFQPFVSSRSLVQSTTLPSKIWFDGSRLSLRQRSNPGGDDCRFSIHRYYCQSAYLRRSSLQEYPWWHGKAQTRMPA